MKSTLTKIEKVVVNSGIGRIAINNATTFEKKILPQLMEDFALVIGQKPLTIPAKISIAGFKLRKGVIVGLKATLRGRRKDQFLTKLVTIILPRVRDFKGINLKNIDNHGNLSIGIKDVTTFPEYTLDVSRVNFGLEVVIVPKSRKREEATAIYGELKIPFSKE